MKNIVIMLSLGAFLLINAALLPVMAEAQPPGLEKQEKIPPGFTEGRKAGWDGENPPGWDQMGEQERHEWSRHVREGRKHIANTARKQGMTEEEAKAAADDYEWGVRKGQDPKEAESRMKEKMHRGEKWGEVSDSISEEQETPRGKKSDIPDVRRGGDSKNKAQGKGKK